MYGYDFTRIAEDEKVQAVARQRLTLASFFSGHDLEVTYYWSPSQSPRATTLPLMPNPRLPAFDHPSSSCCRAGNGQIAAAVEISRKE